METSSHNLGPSFFTIPVLPLLSFGGGHSLPFYRGGTRERVFLSRDGSGRKIDLNALRKFAPDFHLGLEAPHFMQSPLDEPDKSGEPCHAIRHLESPHHQLILTASVHLGFGVRNRRLRRRHSHTRAVHFHFPIWITSDAGDAD